MKKVALYAILLLSTLWACTSAKKENQDGSAYNQAEQSLEKQIKNVVYNIPPPAEVPYMLQATGADFNKGLIADNKNADKCLNLTEKAALNLGIYATDIGYLSSYDKTQEAINYLGTCKKLAESLGIASSFSLADIKRFEANVANKDSLASILNTSIVKSDKFLRDDSRSKLAALILTGSFAEGLSISTGLIKSYPKNLLPNDQRNQVLAPLVDVIRSQSKTVDEFTTMLNGLADKAEPIPGILKDMDALKESYKAFGPRNPNELTDVLKDENLLKISSIAEHLKKIITE